MVRVELFKMHSKILRKIDCQDKYTENSITQLDSQISSKKTENKYEFFHLANPINLLFGN